VENANRILYNHNVGGVKIMAKIVKLNEHLSNMIAAGEVVERISSVVKELVENSLDANATNIEINLIDSGLREINIIDNGSGMDKEDVILCFLSHATSKIKNQHDLFRINTLGFRGEAIPSIASVSDMIIKSNSGNEGYYVRMKSSKIVEEGTIALNRGTVVNVSNLFFNTPARLKYLKSENIELANVCELVDKLAIANPKVRFKLTNNKKTLLQTTGNNDMKSILGSIYGTNVIKDMMELSEEENGIKLKLFLIPPTINKARKNAITLVVNGRSVKNYQIINTVIEAYSTLLPNNRYPIAVVFINVDAMMIDINVHPTKAEIKFSSEKMIKDLISKTIKKALSFKQIIPEMSIYKEYKNDSVYRPNKEDAKVEYINDLFEEETIDYEKPKKEALPVLEYIGQYAGTYLLFQNEIGLFLMDQHAAAERIRYEHYLYELANPIRNSQELMFPSIIDVTQKEKIFVLDNMEIFNSLGITLEQAGENSFYLRSVPVWVINNPEEITEEIISFIIANKTVKLEKIRDELAKTISCKGAIKANKSLNLDEVNALVSQLSKCDNPYTCPHGRPTLIKFSEVDIEKMFLRII